MRQPRQGIMAAAIRRSSVKRYWETIADNLTKADWSWGCVAAVDSRGRTIWIADAHAVQTIIRKREESIFPSGLCRRAPSMRGQQHGSTTVGGTQGV